MYPIWYDHYSASSYFLTLSSRSPIYRTTDQKIVVNSHLSHSWRRMCTIPCWSCLSNIHTYIHTFNGLFSRTTWVSWHQKGKPIWILLKQEMMGGRGISWTICKSFAPHSRQITTPVPHHSIFTGRMLFLMLNQRCQNTEGIGLVFPTWSQIAWVEMSVL